MILFVREGIYERLRDRIWPSTAVFVIILGAQIALNGFDDRELITQISVAMLAVILLLLVPGGIYTKVFRPKRPEPVPA